MFLFAELQSRFRPALAALVEKPDPWLEMMRRAQDARFGDYQANFAMGLSKQLKKKPQELAAEIVAKLDADDIFEPPQVAGPGFINLRLKDDWIVRQLTAAVDDPRLGVQPATVPRTYVVDFSAPNVAKPMHVGHIRSTVIGDALCRTLRFLGHKVVSDNHIGDWGTQFGMIIYGYKHFLDAEAYRQRPVEELARLYRLVRAKAEEDPQVERASQEETAKLHAYDAENLRLWREVMPFCLEDIERIYRLLNVHFDHTLGESHYHKMLPGVVEELRRRGIAQESQGAVCVFIEGQRDPMIVQKRDGAYLYATTDLATIRYRMEQWRPDAILYVVDHRQRLHFQQLFATARLLGYEKVELQHVSFGTVLGKDGKAFKTRAGDTVGLEGLLDEAIERAGRIVAENDDAKPGGPELSPKQRAQVAETVGIGGLKYADLAQNRTSDYEFSYEKMLNKNGDSATYMQYSYARVRQIFAKGGVDAAALRCARPAIVLNSPAERAMALELLRFGDALLLAASDYRPNQLTAYLFGLANGFSTFYDACPVLKAETRELRDSRLLLCDLTARTIEKGLELLGIGVEEKM